ncbi:MAG: apolipoprotein N-acyltransferase [Halanaerobiaceae bacterium]
MSYIFIVFSAILLIIPFTYPDLYFLTWVGLIPALFSLLNKRDKGWESLTKGWLLGTLLMGGIGYWLFFPVAEFTGLPYTGILIILILLFLIFGSIYGLWAYSFVKIQLGNKFHPVLLAVSWTALEYLRYKIFNFFPLGFLGYSQLNFDKLIQFTEYGGVFLITFIVILLNGFLYKLFKYGHKKSILAFFLIICLISGWGYIKMNNIEDNLEESINIGIVPTQISQQDKWSPDNIEKNIDMIFKKIYQIKESDLVITPETSLTFDITRNEYYRNIFKEKMESVNTYIQVGSQAAKSENKNNNHIRSNSSFLIGPEGNIIYRYNKNHLVLFGEYIPFRKIVNRVAGTGLNSLASGNQIVIFEKNGVSWKTVTCSEILKPIFVQKKSEKVNFMINQTNEAWYKNSNLKNQMWAAAKFRAVENRLPVVRAGNYAYNGIIYPEGNTTKRDFELQDSFTVDIKTLNYSTLYQRWKNYFGYISALIWMVIIILKLYAYFSRRKKLNSTD